MMILSYSYRPSVPASFVREQLNLTLDHEWDKFLSDTSLESAILYIDSPANTKINTKESYPILMAAL